MPDIPQEAIDALAQELCADEDSDDPEMVWQVYRGDAENMLRRVAPLLAEHVRRDLIAAAETCTACGEIHKRRRVVDTVGFSYSSWAHPDDGHVDSPLSKEAAWFIRQIGETL